MKTIYPSKEELVKLMKENFLLVKFTKKDGTEREMTCTLIPENLPPQFLNGDEQFSKKTRKPNDEVVSTFDVDKKEWRSFRLDSLIEYRCIGQRTI